MKIAFYGGSFDPVHCGHVTIGERLLDLFGLDRFVFLPAFHAPHKPDLKPTSSYHRHAMLCLATKDSPYIEVSQLELELPERQYTVDTLPRLLDFHPRDEVYFVMGADSWEDIRTWREWERVLLMSNHIVVTRPGHDIGFHHVTDEVRQRIVDLRGTGAASINETLNGYRIYITDVVNLDISSTRVREQVRSLERGWENDVPKEVAKYIEKYQIYK